MRPMGAYSIVGGVHKSAWILYFFTMTSYIWIIMNMNMIFPR